MVRRHTILVVDDEPDVVRSLQDLLRLDYRVLGATRAAEGLGLMREQVVHVVMTDQRMPEMTGVEFLRQVRSEHPDVVRLLFTGYADVKAVIDAINQGSVYRYITKPWDPDELQTILRQAVEQYELRMERKRLLAELQVKNEELQRANADLTQANALQEAFIRVAGHELRTPLTILLGLSHLALRTPGLTDTVRDWLTRIARASERLHRLIEQLMKMLAAGQYDRPLEKQPTDLTALLEQAAQDVQPFVRQRQQTLTLSLAPDLGRLAIDADKIRDSVDNLLLNAIKFTPDGGTIQLTGTRSPASVQIGVTDSGVGIDAANRRHLFKAFFTGVNVARHSSGQFEFGRQGLGLGLTLVRTFVELHGGRVEVESEPGKGSTFLITLPILEST